MKTLKTAIKAAIYKMADSISLIKYRSKVKEMDAVLLNTPRHGNLGDHAIAICENEFLSDLGIKVIDFQWFGNDLQSVARSTPKDKLILISGGGYLGDLWPEEEYRVREIIKAFSEYRIIVLPQTVSFDLTNEKSRLFFEESKRIYQKNTNLTLFVREKISFDFVKDNMPGIDVRLVPDMAMLFRYGGNCNRNGILVCMRDDIESMVPHDVVETVIKGLNERFGSVMCIDTVIGDKLSKHKRNEAVNEMIGSFAGSKCVVTDRLHGMIFSAVTETPCVVVKSRSHKIRGCYEWLKELGYIKIADDINEIPGLVDKMVDLKPEYNYGRIREAFDPLKNELTKLTDSGE